MGMRVVRPDMQGVRPRHTFQSSLVGLDCCFGLREVGEGLRQYNVSGCENIFLEDFGWHNVHNRIMSFRVLIAVCSEEFGIAC
jgi:hypothetical protein